MLALSPAPPIALVAATLLGFAGFAANPALNARVFSLADSAPSLAGASNVAAFNVGIVAAPWLGGLTIDAGLGYGSVTWVGMALAVVALAATHSPDELNFVLVDFKGGATFLGCESLPHTAAVITNLEDEAVLVERMFDAISGEMHRRQELLRAAGNFANITDYTKAGNTLPSLVIVVDEFTELLTQHPRLAEQIARSGHAVHVWTVNTEPQLRRCQELGVEAVITDRPAYVLELLGK